GGPHRAPGEQHVVDEDHHPIVERARQPTYRPGHDRAQADVVAVEADVEHADLRPSTPFDAVDRISQPFGQPGAAAGQADEHHPVGTGVALPDLVSDAGDRPPHVVAVEDLSPGSKNAPGRGRRTLAWLWHQTSSVRASQDPFHGLSNLSGTSRGFL